jgi:hypothetical protein
MGIAIEGIANYEYADGIRSLVPAEGRLKYFIDRYGTTKGIAATSGEINTVDVTIKYLDSITGMDLEETNDPLGAQVIFFKASPGYYQDSNTIGLTEFDGSSVLVSWREQDSQDWREYSTIQHEIGHLFALSHPYGNGWNSAYDKEDTVMSYNSDYYSVNSFTDSDKAALKAIWGEDTKILSPGRGTHYGTAFNDAFYLKDFDGFGENSADVIYNFSAANGDKLQISTAGAGWDPSKEYYNFWTISDRSETYRSGWRKVWKGGKKRLRPVYSTRTVNNLDSVVTRNDTNALIYNTSSGELLVDRNGSAYGLGDGGLIAILADAPNLTTSSISWFSS